MAENWTLEADRESEIRLLGLGSITLLSPLVHCPIGLKRTPEIALIMEQKQALEITPWDLGLRTPIRWMPITQVRTARVSYSLASVRTERLVQVFVGVRKRSSQPGRPPKSENHLMSTNWPGVFSGCLETFVSIRRRVVVIIQTYGVYWAPQVVSFV